MGCIRCKRDRNSVSDDAPLPRPRGDTTEWSLWLEIMVPDSREEYLRKNSEESLFKKRNGEGWRLKPKYLKKNFGKDDRGIYEIKKVRYNEAGEITESEVVYVGKANAKNEYPLYRRIKSYSVSGSHKKEEIDSALEDGESLDVRFRTSKNPERAEGKLLKKYKYPWNKKGSKADDDTQEESEDKEEEEKEKDEEDEREKKKEEEKEEEEKEKEMEEEKEKKEEEEEEKEEEEERKKQEEEERKKQEEKEKMRTEEEEKEKEKEEEKKKVAEKEKIKKQEEEKEKEKEEEKEKEVEDENSKREEEAKKRKQDMEVRDKEIADEERVAAAEKEEELEKRMAMIGEELESPFLWMLENGMLPL